MASRTELIPLALAVLLAGGVAAMAIETRTARNAQLAARERLRSEAAAAATADSTLPTGAADGPAAHDRIVSGTVQPGDLGALPLRVAALPAPSRDIGWIQRTLRLAESGTYIANMLAEDDSTLSRWPDRTVAALRVWVQPHSPSVTWDRAYPEMVRSVFSEWSAAGFPVRFLHVVDSASADVHIRFTTTLPGRHIGVTNRLRDVNSWLVGAEIVIATQDRQGQPFPGSFVAGIARHEVGHALGLGHADDPAALMYPEARTISIGASDRATLHLLYMLPPGAVR